MASIRMRKFIQLLLLVGSVPACGGDGSPQGGATDGSTTRADAPSSAATRRAPEEAVDGPSPPWRARAGGPTLAEHVVEQARARASRPYRRRPRRVTATVADLTYGQYRGISFRRDSAVWRGEAPFELQFFHPGGGNDLPVWIHLVEGERSTLRPFRPGDFRYGDEVQGMDLDLPADAGYAGFRILTPLNDPARMDEVVSFLGASYFRLLGPGQVYGLSSRGIAVDVAQPGGEEFPDFVEFWVRRPSPGDTTLTFHGLLDGPSLAGAYHFHLVPGDADSGRGTVLSVEARLFSRDAVGKLGVAPLTSMYLHGTFRPGGDDDVRPRVHDSEGLLMHTSKDEWIWRPLTNGTGLRTTSLRDVDPQGFGLVQRDRDFGNYLDLETRYDLRPSEWVAVEGEWGGGGVELVEIPTDSEFNDNVVAYWAPDGGMPAGAERTYRYHLVTFDERLAPTRLDGRRIGGEVQASVIRTRIGWDALPGQADPPPRTRRRILVDFAGGPLDRLPAEAPVEAVVSTSSGTLEDIRVLSLPAGGRRATFVLAPESRSPADLRLFLQVGDSVVSETWSYLWNPDHAR
ncbi:MAG: glucan biosynthesis protein G [Gemmatimonadota bacterium]